MFNKICVVGLGYIGLPTASLLATKNYDVLGVDINPQTVETINRGGIHLYEPELDVLVRSAVGSGQLHAAVQPGPADVFIVAVPTPFKDNHQADLSYIKAATTAIAPHLCDGNLLILESTSPVGTTEKMARWLTELRPDLIIPTRHMTPSSILPREQIYLAHCPERVLPGKILQELVTNDRIIGGLDASSAVRASDFYNTFVAGEVLATDSRTAELCKLAENSFRDVNIAFANELSIICERLDIDPWTLIDLANRHPRVNIHRPGPGVGGHCIAVDPWFIVDSMPDQARLIRAAREVNEAKPLHVITKVKEKASRFKSPVIACLGLSYKANIDDLRESPAVKIVRTLAQDGLGRLLVVEPHLKTLPESLAGLNLELTPLTPAVDAADLVVLLVNHRAFRNISPNTLKDKVIIDTHGMWR
ncbi:MAG: UDP-N-acetyl-D-mannosamine dehydrogenase [Deltaproteobacteria bacterium]|nr:UDP-N-acetyl-D-mannosamine dehydrogenase [Deltaproteobacteria bacterium]